MTNMEKLMAKTITYFFPTVPLLMIKMSSHYVVNLRNAMKNYCILILESRADRNKSTLCTRNN
jgi:hypothetical protein